MDNESYTRKVGDKMHQRIIVIKNETGIHARPASLIVKEAQRFKADILLIRNDSEYNCKSIMSILSTGGKKGAEMLLKATGEDSEAAIEALGNLLESNLDA